MSETLESTLEKECDKQNIGMKTVVYTMVPQFKAQERNGLIYDPFRKWSFVANERNFNDQPPILLENTRKLTKIEEPKTPKGKNLINTIALNKTHFSDENTQKEFNEYAAEEIAFIVEGVHKYGRNWEYIKSSFNFKPNRSAEEIAKQYFRIRSNFPHYFNNKIARLPFTSCEDRRLRRGIAKYGVNNWNMILNDYLFAPNRTGYDLQERWNYLRLQDEFI